MLGFLGYWGQEAKGLYKPVNNPGGEQNNASRPSGLQFIVQKIYQVAPFLLLLNLVLAAIWTARGLSHISNRPKSFAPDMPITTTIFEENPTFTAPPSPESDAAWDALRPKGGGAVTVPNAEAYGLKPGIPIENGPDVYGVSMFHQLHCLSILRRSYYAALNGTLPAFTNPDIYLLSEEKQLMLHRGHVAHCFDYVRQGIMCAGDLTFESAAKFPDKWLEGISEDFIREKYGDRRPVLVDGWGIEHRCRSFEEAKEWTFRNRVPDDSGVVL